MGNNEYVIPSEKESAIKTISNILFEYEYDSRMMPLIATKRNGIENEGFHGVRCWMTIKG